MKQILQGGGTSWGVMAFEFFTPGLSAVLADAGAEFVFLDMEHSGAGIDTIKAQMAFARAAGITPLVRVPYCERHLVTVTLDAGAAGIMVPMLETAEQAGVRFMVPLSARGYARPGFRRRRARCLPRAAGAAGDGCGECSRCSRYR